MSTVRIQTGATERIEYLVRDGSLSPLTGKSDILVSIRRISDGQYLDFDDDTFKSSGWTTRQTAMSEVSATYSPGTYSYDFDTSSITNPTTDDTYVARVEQSPGTDAANLPAEGEIKVGEWVDDIDAPISGRAAPGDAMDLVTDAVDSDAVATSGANEIRDSILSDSTPFAGADIDVAISSRSSHTANDVRDSILSDSTPFQGARIDAAISSRSSHTANDVRDAILSDSTPFAGADIDAAISSRSSHTPADVDTELSGTHGAGSWEDDSPTPGDVADAVWDEALSGHTGPGTAGEAQSHLDADVSSRATQADILSDATPFPGGNVDAQISTRSSHTPGDVDTVLSGTHGSGSWEDDSPTPGDVADAVWDEDLTGHTDPNSAGESLGRVDVDVSSRSSHTPADVDTELSGSHGSGSWESPSVGDIADGVWDEDVTAHTGPNSTGEAQNRLDADVSSRAAPTDILSDSTPFQGARIDAAISSRSDHTPADVDTVLSASHGAGSWEDDSPTPGDVADAVWDEDLSGHSTPGSAGEHQLRLNATVDSRATQADILSDATPFQGARVDAAISSRSSHTPADVDTVLSGSHGSGSWEDDSPAPGTIAGAVWDEDVTTHTAPNSAGEAQNRLDADVSSRSSHTPADVDTELSGSHGSGSWEVDSGIIADAVWDEALSGHSAPGSTGEAQSHLDADVSSRAVQGDAMDLVNDAVDSASLATSGVNEIRDSILSDSTPFPGGNVDAQISSRSSHTPADVDTELSGSHGATSWETGPSVGDIADGVWDEALSGHSTPGSTGEAQGHLDVDVSTRSDHTPADVDTELTAAHGSGAWNTGDPSAIADAVWDEDLSGHTGPGSAGESMGRLDVDVSTRSSHTPADVDTELTAQHGSGSWEAASVDPSAIADAVWDELAEDHVSSGSMGELQNRVDDGSPFSSGHL